jgi:uncharacterized protein with HEPN domain
MKDRIFLRHILGAIDRIEGYTDNCSEKQFLENFMIQDAVMRNLEIVGEASKRITTETKLKSSGIPWKQMSGMRDKLIHDYFGVDLAAVGMLLTLIYRN